MTTKKKKKLTSKQMTEYIGSFPTDELAEVISEANSYNCRRFCGGYAFGRFFHLDPRKEDGNRYLIVYGIFNSHDDAVNDAEWDMFKTRDELLDAAIEAYYGVTEDEEFETLLGSVAEFEPVMARLLRTEYQHFQQAEQ